MKQGEKKPSWSERQHLALIEARLQWAGAVAPEEVAEAFGIGHAEAEKACDAYRRLCPANVAADQDGAPLRCGDSFEPRFLRGTARELLQVLRALPAAGGLPLALATAGVPVEALEAPEREPDARVLQRITAAIAGRNWLTLCYRIRAADEPETLELAPHALFHAGRWYFRAFLRAENAFRDFRLTRVEGLPALRGGGAPTAEEDWEWRNFVTVKIGPHPELGEVERRAVEADHGMQNGVLEKAVRLALVRHYLRLAGVDGDERARSASEQPVILLNRAELEAYTRRD